MLYHEYGLRFTSPLINCWRSAPDFIEFSRDYEAWLRKTPEVYFSDGEATPVLSISADGKNRSIPIHFIHDRDAKTVLDNWTRRRARIANRDKTAFILCDNTGLSKSEIEEFLAIPGLKKRIVLVPCDRDELPDVPSIVRVPGCSKDHFELTAFRGCSGFRMYHCVDWRNFFAQSAAQKQ